ncbi:MAG: hypothetical protein CMJ83_14735 [Planctomycetes bacterium]|nr:hypothetical protein [Planctomycetota bacterium]
MADDWDRVVKRAQETCAVCEEALAADAEVVTALDLGADGFTRRDLHPDCYATCEGDAFSVWKWTRARELRPNPRRLDLGFLTEFFKRLEGREEHHARRVQWIVSLLLLRKKILEEVGRKSVDEREVLLLRIKRTEKVYEVTDPQLDMDAMGEIEGDLSRIFNLDQPVEGSDAVKDEEEGNEGRENPGAQETRADR